MSGGGAVLPATQGLDDGGATQRARSLPLEPQAQAVLTEHVLEVGGGGWGAQRQTLPTSGTIF